MLHNLISPKTIQKSTQIGRGMGSGRGGHTSGRGGKGQTAHGGHKQPRPGFEGGQNPISRRLPKYRGETTGKTRDAFNALQRSIIIQLSELAESAKENNVSEINIETLVTLGFVRPSYNKVLVTKILFDKEISVALTIKDITLSKAAKSAVIKAGGKVE